MDDLDKLTAPPAGCCGRKRLFAALLTTGLIAVACSDGPAESPNASSRAGSSTSPSDRGEFDATAQSGSVSDDLVTLDVNVTVGQSGEEQVAEIETTLRNNSNATIDVDDTCPSSAILQTDAAPDKFEVAAGPVAEVFSTLAKRINLLPAQKDTGGIQTLCYDIVPSSPLVSGDSVTERSRVQFSGYGPSGSLTLVVSRRYFTSAVEGTPVVKITLRGDGSGPVFNVDQEMRAMALALAEPEAKRWIESQALGSQADCCGWSKMDASRRRLTFFNPSQPGSVVGALGFVDVDLNGPSIVEVVDPN